MVDAKSLKKLQKQSRHLCKENPLRNNNKKGQEVQDLYAVSGKGILGKYGWMFAFVIVIYLVHPPRHS